MLPPILILNNMIKCNSKVVQDIHPVWTRATLLLVLALIS